jgi:hypothetical protein
MNTINYQDTVKLEKSFEQIYQYLELISPKTKSDNLISESIGETPK